MLVDEAWIVLVFDCIDGRHPRLDDPPDLEAVLDAVARLSITLTPAPFDADPAAQSLAGTLGAWQRIVATDQAATLDSWSRTRLDQLIATEAMWPTVVAGNTLLHTDLRPDNMLIDQSGKVWIVDWADPCVGAAWIDTLLLLVSVAAAGVDPEPILRQHPTTAMADPAALHVWLVALAGHWVWASRQPPPQRSPNLRPFQARRARVMVDWLKRLETHDSGSGS